MRSKEAANRNGRAGQLVLETVPVSASLYEPLLTPAQAAALLAVRPSWIYEAVRAGRLPCK